MTLYEKEPRFGGHSHTVEVNGVTVDTGFIVFNKKTYPHLTALFAHLDVPIQSTDMSFGVSLRDGELEYSGTNLAGLFAQRRNLLSLTFWRMLTELLRFYRSSKAWQATITPSLTLRELLTQHRFGRRFIDDHLIPMGAAIWSTPADKMLDYPALAFLRFCENHGLLQ